MELLPFLSLGWPSRKGSRAKHNPEWGQKRVWGKPLLGHRNTLSQQDVADVFGARYPQTYISAKGPSVGMLPILFSSSRTHEHWKQLAE